MTKSRKTLCLCFMQNRDTRHIMPAHFLPLNHSAVEWQQRYEYELGLIAWLEYIL